MKIALDLQCPICGSRHIRRSRRSGAITALARALLLTPYRCRSCRQRFYRAFEIRRAAPAD